MCAYESKILMTGEKFSNKKGQLECLLRDYIPPDPQIIHWEKCWKMVKKVDKLFLPLIWIRTKNLSGSFLIRTASSCQVCGNLSSSFCVIVPNNQPGKQTKADENRTFFAWGNEM